MRCARMRIKRFRTRHTQFTLTTAILENGIRAVMSTSRFLMSQHAFCPCETARCDGLVSLFKCSSTGSPPGPFTVPAIGLKSLWCGAEHMVRNHTAATYPLLLRCRLRRRQTLKDMTLWNSVPRRGTSALCLSDVGHCAL